MSRRYVCVFVGVLLLAAIPGLAQTTGSIQGQVNDHEDNALPGVTVVLSGDPIPGAQRTVVTDVDGDFQYMALPVGRYSLSATLDGFKPQTVDNVRVPIDGTTSVIFRMPPDAFAEEIAVTGESPLVDVVSSSVSASYDSEFVEDLPSRNNFYDILSVAPTVSQPNEEDILIAAYGANMHSQSWNIDGQSMVSPGGGWIVWALNPDMIAETSLVQGAGAQYGSTLGNVWNVVTKTGTNSFHGSLTTFFQHDDLLDQHVTLDPSEWADYRLHDPGAEYVIDDYYDYRGTLGGPIVRDKLWFIAGAQISKRKSTGPYDIPGVQGAGYEADRYDAKLTAQLARNHRLDIKGHSTDWYTAGAPSMYAEYTTMAAEDPKTEMVLADYNAVLSDSTLLNVRAGAWQVSYERYTVNGNELGTLYEDIYDGPALWFGGPWWMVPREEEANQADLIVSHFADEFIKGSHEFKFGVQYYEGFDHRHVQEPRYAWKWPPNTYAYGWPYYIQYWQVAPGAEFYYGGDMETLGAFIDDSWKISDRLTLDIGVRWDRQQAWIPDFPRLDQEGNPTGEILTGEDMIDWSNWAPRLGFAWQPTDSGKTVIRGYAGRFWDGPTAAAWWSPPPERGPSEVAWIYPNFCPWWCGTIYSQPVPSAEDLLDPNVKNPYSDEFSLSFDHQIGRNYAIGGQAVYKTTDDLIGWQIADDGEVYPFIWDDPYTEEVEQIQLIDAVVWPSLRKSNDTGPGALLPNASYHVEYRAAVLTFRKRYSNGWDLMASYTWSKTEGVPPVPRDRYAGGLGQNWPAGTDQTGSQPNDWYNADQLMQGDREHMFRVQSNVNLGWGTRLSAVLNLQSGRPYQRRAQIIAPYTFNPITIIADIGDHLRHPTSAVLDLGLQKTFSLGKGVDFDIGLQVLNALNDDASEYVLDQTLNPGQQFEGSDWIFPRRLQVKFKLAF